MIPLSVKVFVFKWYNIEEKLLKLRQHTSHLTVGTNVKTFTHETLYQQSKNPLSSDEELGMFFQFDQLDLSRRRKKQSHAYE